MLASIRPSKGKLSVDGDQHRCILTERRICGHALSVLQLGLGVFQICGNARAPKGLIADADTWIPASRARRLTIAQASYRSSRV
jgi:hypothetical protein